ncbi:MAG: mechanosensitive ion channel family protein [Clostridia bacterium]|nr:mechanosensitive ion channel family protein [Clostridia bacterium]
MDSFIANLSSEELRNLIQVFDIQIAIVIVLLVFFTRNVVSRIILKIFDFLTKKKENPQNSEMYEPIKLMYMFMGIYLAVKILPVTKELSIIMTSLLKSALVIFATNIINSTIFVRDSKFFRKKNKGTNETVSYFICKIARIITWIVAIYIILVVILGFTQINGLVTGLGIGTVVISLAAQDTVKSLFSGITILSEKPFVIGDWIEVGEVSGTVIDISFRSTRIRSMNNSIVTIPNSTITSEYVVNWNKLKSRRFDCILNLEMKDIDPDKIKDIIKELKVVICAKDYVQRDTVYVGFNGISAYSYDIKIFVYVTETNYTKYLKIEEDLNCEFINVLAKEDVRLAYPTQTLNVHSVENKNEQI